MGRFTDVPLRRSATLGFASFVVGYLVTYLLMGRRAVAIVSGTVISMRTTDPFTMGDLFASPPSLWKAVGWLFYGAQFAKIQAPNPFVGLGAVNPVLQASGSVVWLVAIPLTLTFVAGFVAVGVSDATTYWGVFFTGWSIAVGYAVPAAVTTVAMAVRTPKGLVAVDLLWGIVFVGWIYPATIGTTAGFLSHELRKRGYGFDFEDKTPDIPRYNL